MVLHDAKVLFDNRLAGLFANFPEQIGLTRVAPLSYEGQLNGTLTVDSTFDEFVTSFLSQEYVPFALLGKTDALSTLSIGNISVTGVTLDQSVTIKGTQLRGRTTANINNHIAGLRSLQGCMTIDVVTITGGFANGIYMTLHMTINNPSDAFLNLGRGTR